MTKRKSPEATYRAEKAKRDRPQSHDQLMSEAKAQFEQFLADGRAARKGGRPKRGAVKPVVAPEDRDEELGE